MEVEWRWVRGGVCQGSFDSFLEVEFELVPYLEQMKFLCIEITLLRLKRSYISTKKHFRTMNTSLLKFVFSLSYLAQSFNPSFLFSGRHNSSLLTLKRSFKGVTSSPFHPKLNPYLKVQTSLIIDLIFGLKFLFSLFVSMRKEAKMPP